MTTNLHLAWAELLVASLVKSGVHDFVVSPGSRSTPLVLALAARTDVRTHVVVDERSAAFFALGQARVSGRPSVLVCTSGTAAAHYYPAIIEASAAFVPLVALTADRPWEDRDTGASQTIDQVKMFAGYVRHFADVGTPEANPAAMRSLARIATQAVHASLAPTPGPVHVNAQFRKPLEPQRVSGREPWEDAHRELLERAAPVVARAPSSPPSEAVLAVATACAKARRGVVVAGPLPIMSDDDRRAIFAFAEAAGFAVLAEATSQLRFGTTTATRLEAFDAIHRSGNLRAELAPDCVVELGAPATSAGHAALLADLGNVPRFVVAPHGHLDPRGDATLLVRCDVADLAREIEPKLRQMVKEPTSTEWLARVAVANEVAARVLAGFASSDPLDEPTVARTVAAALPHGARFIIGNSNPVRDVDTFAAAGDRSIHVLHQRGAAGIDGIVSGAAGAASIDDVPTVALLGDLTFLHDAGGLAVAAKTKSPLVLVVVANGGGRIFEELPLHASPEAERAFEPFFATPQEVDRAALARAFGIRFVSVGTRDALAAAVGEATKSGAVTIVEAVVDPHAASKIRAAARAAVERAVLERLGS